MKLFITLIISMSFSLAGYSQNKTIDETLSYLERKFQDPESTTRNYSGDHSYYECSYHTIIIDSVGKISIDGGTIDYNSNGVAGKKDLFVYTFSAFDVKLSYIQFEQDYSILITCNENATSNCIEYIGTVGFDHHQYVQRQTLNFASNVEREKIFNALQYLLQKIGTTQKYQKSKNENDPFAPQNMSTNQRTVINNGSSGQQIANSNSKPNVVNMVKKSGNTYEVPVQLNGVLKINFIFDSGASDISISGDVALTLIRTGTINQADYIGTQKYKFADGSTATSKVFMLHEIKIGNKVLRNVKASISESLDAPMLLGQSVLQRFGKFTIDNGSHTLTID